MLLATRRIFSPSWLRLRGRGEDTSEAGDLTRLKKGETATLVLFEMAGCMAPPAPLPSCLLGVDTPFTGLRATYG